MADTAHAKPHDYHLVDPSPWPAMGAFSALILAVGAIMFMHDLGGGGWVMAAGFALVLLTMFVWWRDVVREGEYEGHHTGIVQIGLRYGMVLFIASEVMFFVAWFWIFFEGAIFHEARLTEGWGQFPPEGIETFDPFHIPLINTLILLLSGTTVTWAHHALQVGDRKNAKLALALTVVLGLSFTSLQFYEYATAHFAFSGSLYGAAFFMATGFHGAHVIIGTIFLLVCLIRLMAGQFTPEKHFGFEAAAWYWHFVDVVWLFLFTFVYVVYG